MLIDVMSFNLRIWTPVTERMVANRQAAVVSIITKYACDSRHTRGLPPMLAGLDSAFTSTSVLALAGTKIGREHNAVYSKGQVKLVEQGQFWLSKEPSVPGSISWDSSLRICTWGLFQGSEGTPCGVYTHLDHEGEDARRSGAELIWQKIEPLQAEGIPCILMGDFNCEPGSAPVQLFRSHLKDALWEMGAGGHTFHAFTGLGVGGWIDYIFASPGVQILEAEIVKEKVAGRFPSDHYPIRARLVLPPQP